MVFIYIKLLGYARQSISFTEPNDEWIKTQVDKKEYSSKSELFNKLIRQARKQQVQVDWNRAKLIKWMVAEQEKLLIQVFLNPEKTLMVSML